MRANTVTAHIVVTQQHNNHHHLASEIQHNGRLHESLFKFKVSVQPLPDDRHYLLTLGALYGPLISPTFPISFHRDVTNTFPCTKN